jgi:hypothetical protein
MLWGLKNLKKCSAVAKDGKLGLFANAYFEKDRWMVPLISIKTGPWLFGRNVLLAPDFIERIQTRQHRIEIDISKQEVLQHETVEQEKAIARKNEDEARNYYGWPLFWGYVPGPDPYYPVMGINQFQFPGVAAEYTPEPKDVVLHPPVGQLKDGEEILGFKVQAIDGEIGYVQDLMIDLEKWTVSYLIVETGSWFYHDRVAISTQWVRDILDLDVQLDVDLMRETIEQSPTPMDDSKPWTNAQAKKLYDYYVRDKHWVWG